MSDGPSRYAYVAVDAAGRKVRGELNVASEAAAFSSLKSQGLMPVTVKAAIARRESAAKAVELSDRDTAELVSDLAALLAAGSDIRTALTIIGGKAARPNVQAAAKVMARDISGGDALSAALERQLAERHRFIAALLSAGEVSSDLIGGLERGAEMLEARIKMRDQLVSVLAYPVFVMLTAIVSFLIILTLVVPSLAPLAEAPGAEPGLPMRLLLAASRFLTGNGWLLAGTLLAIAIAGAAAGAAGLLRGGLERLVLDGPGRRTAEGLIYGGFAIALGGMLAAGAPIGEALRLSLRSVRSRLAQKRLEPVGGAVRQGTALSVALTNVNGFPDQIGRLALIGEEVWRSGPDAGQSWPAGGEGGLEAHRNRQPDCRSRADRGAGRADRAADGRPAVGGHGPGGRGAAIGAVRHFAVTRLPTAGC